MTCPHGEAHPSACFDCLEGPPPEKPAARWERVGTPFPAQHPGLCGGCAENIEPGQPIQRWDCGGDATVYAHARCPL